MSNKYEPLNPFCTNTGGKCAVLTCEGKECFFTAVCKNHMSTCAWETEVDKVVPIGTAIASFSSPCFSGGRRRHSEALMGTGTALYFWKQQLMIGWSHPELLWCALKCLADICICHVGADIVVSFYWRNRETNVSPTKCRACVTHLCPIFCSPSMVLVSIFWKQRS